MTEHPISSVVGAGPSPRFPGWRGPDEVAFVYRNPDARWKSYDKVLLEPVTLWRSGRKSLDAVPEGDLLRLVTDLEGAVARRLGTGFQIVDAPGSGMMRIRLGVTDARASDPTLDVLRARAGGAVTRGDGSIDPETRRFIESAQIEGEIRDADTNQLLAAGVDRRRARAPSRSTRGADVDRALGFWADRLCTRLRGPHRGTPRPLSPRRRAAGAARLRGGRSAQRAASAGPCAAGGSSSDTQSASSV